MTLARWLEQHSIVGLSGVDTRAITEIVREHGTLTGRLSFLDTHVSVCKQTAGLEHAAPPTLKRFEATLATKLEVLVIDCGVKTNQLRCLLDVGLNITVNHHAVRFVDTVGNYNGIFISNGPGDPKDYPHVIEQLRHIMQSPSLTLFGICLGHQLLALASGLDTIKMK